MTKNRGTDSAVSLTPRTREVEVSGINDVAESFESVRMSEFLRLLFCKLWTCDTFIAKVFSLTRVVMNVSQLAGPWVGGMLYELDGFYLPFLVMGAIQVQAVSSLLIDTCTVLPMGGRDALRTGRILPALPRHGRYPGTQWVRDALQTGRFLPALPHHRRHPGKDCVVFASRYCQWVGGFTRWTDFRWPLPLSWVEVG